MKKGFTLVEMLAVLVVLGIISAFAIPKVVDIISESKQSSVEDSAKSYIKVINKYLVEHDDYFTSEGSIFLSVEGSDLRMQDVSNLNDKLKTTGTLPCQGMVYVNSDYSVEKATLKFKTHTIEYNGIEYETSPASKDQCIG